MAKSIEDAIERSILAAHIIELARRARDTDRALDAHWELPLGERIDVSKKDAELEQYNNEFQVLLNAADDAAQALWTALDEWDKQGEAHDTYHCG
jgi:hypothetical protein